MTLTKRERKLKRRYRRVTLNVERILRGEPVVIQNELGEWYQGHFRVTARLTPPS